MGTTFDIVITAIALIAGVLLLTGHGDFLMKGGNADVRKKTYDETKMQKASGVTMILIGVVTAIDIFTTSFWAKNAYLVAILVIFIGFIVYVRKKCRKQ